jgi:hypothetical protein
MRLFCVAAIAALSLTACNLYFDSSSTAKSHHEPAPDAMYGIDAPGPYVPDAGYEVDGGGYQVDAGFSVDAPFAVDAGSCGGGPH